MEKTDTGAQSSVSQAMSSLEDRPGRVTQQEGETRSSIVEFQDVAVQLGRRTIWRQATFALEPGEFVAILRPKWGGQIDASAPVAWLAPARRGQCARAGTCPTAGQSRHRLCTTASPP